MAYRIRTRDEHFAADGAPKRILALDGGGLRGILTLGILKKIEDELRARHGGSDQFRLCHYFDLIAGTSTGAIIAATLANGWTVDDIARRYVELGTKVFKRSLLRHGLFRARYDEAELIRQLQAVFGDRTLGSRDVCTGLLIVVKRLDSASPWPVSNNPKGKFFASAGDGVIGNGDYALWQAVRASTAAPDYFEPERITIAQREGHSPVYGDFVDGGVSPFNNPALQAFMYATIDGYNIKWATGARQLLLVSVGTGAADAAVKRSQVAAAHAFQSLMSLMDDCAALQETMLQWMSSSPTARQIDLELGNVGPGVLGGTELLSYVRYNVELTAEGVHGLLGKNAVEVPVENLTAMDAPENMSALHALGLAAGSRDVLSAHFPGCFDLPVA